MMNVGSEGIDDSKTRNECCSNEVARSLCEEWATRQCLESFGVWRGLARVLALIFGEDSGSFLRESGPLVYQNVSGRTEGMPKQEKARELIDAAGSGDFATVLRLLRGGASPNVKLRDGLTPLMAAANAGHAEVVKTLLAHGADRNASDDHGLSALMMAIGRRRSEVVALLLEDYDDVDKTFPASVGPFVGWTALMHAARSGDVKSVERLLMKSPDLNMQDGDGETALMKAAESGNREIVELLLKAGADPDLRDHEGFTALDHAEKMGQLKIAETLKKGNGG